MSVTLEDSSVGFVVALLVGLILTEVVRRGGPTLGLVDPTDRDPSGKPIPRSGGLAIFGAWMTGMVVALWRPQGEFGIDPAAWRGPPSSEGWGLLCLVSLGALALGLHDDRTKSSPQARLVVLSGLAVAAALGGFRAESVVLPLMGTVDLGPLSVPLSALWILGVTVSFDFIDGLDGLAAGLALVACGGLWLGGSGAGAAAPLAGALLAFLAFNRPPASLYMGDNGSNLLGLSLGLMSIGLVRAEAPFQPLAGIALVAVPVLDAGLTMIRRARGARSLFASDLGHLHHRLLDAGLSPRYALLCLLGPALLLVALARALS